MHCFSVKILLSKVEAISLGLGYNSGRISPTAESEATSVRTRSLSQRGRRISDIANANRLRSLLLLLMGGMLGVHFASSRVRLTAIAQQINPQASPTTLQAFVAHLKELRPP